MENEAALLLPPLDVVVGMGANLGEPRLALRAALLELGRLGPLAGVSALYRTAPVGGPPQPYFLNAAARLYFKGSPEVLLGEALRIERLAGRERRERWGPRTLDLDILWIRGVTVAAPGLVVPHPRLRQRAFALRPLIDVAPDAVDPAEGALYAEVLAGLREEGIEALGTDWAGADDAGASRGMDRPCS
jgi:2-amino-4-hydroxy-6-hydroxymethyldihydropteridine diphosphokinase